MRRLHKELHERGFHWFREPHWAQLKHDLAVVDFRLSVEKAAKQNPYFCLEEWVNESTFRAKPDIVEYDWRTNGPIQRVHKRVIPDGYFALIAKGQLHQGAAARLRFLLEMDLSSHDNPSFGKEKVLPGIAYILSHTYRGRFGDNSGRWLIVTTGKRRLLNLKHQTEVEGGRNASVFYLTTLDQIQPDTMLSTPIWYRGGDTDRHRFIEPPLTAQRSQENHHS